MKAIEFNNVWEKYRIKFIGGGKVSWEEFWALKDVNFKVDKGEVLGVIGCNGAGKTTLLKLISGALIPDRGEVQVTGRVSVLMELGAGFNPEFTGRENIMFNAQMYGLDKETLAQQMEKIIEFADIGKFIEAPVKYYSQGMYMRLAFALAIFVEPDILLIDDILAVGDEEAQQRCIKKIFELKQAGKTIVLVSHDMNMVNKLCNRVILLEKGKIIQKGSPAKVIPYYLETVGEKKGIAVLEKERARIVFNNGRIIFNYGTELLTKGPGGYATSFVPSINSWLSSSNLNWLAKSPLPDTIVAEGRFQDGPVAQIWTIQLKDDCLQWGLEIKEDVKEPHIDLILSPIYKRWITLDKSGDFPPFAHKSRWQDLGLNSCPESILGVSPGLEIQDLPSLILEQKDKDSSLKLFNTGYEQEGRVIQWHLNINSDNFISIKIFSKKDRFAEHIKNAKARLRALRTISQGNLRLFADLETKSLRLYYKDKEITKAPGLHTSFLINKRWQDNSSTQWQISKEKDSLLVKFFWKAFELTQTCKFSLREGGLLWDIESFSNKPFSLEVLKFGLSLSDEYKTFFCAHQQKDFAKEFSVWQDILLENPRASLFGLRKQNHFPAIVLENQQGYSCVIQNGDVKNACRILQLSLPKQSLAKRRLSFATKINLLGEETPIEGYLKEEKQKLPKRQQEEKQRLLLEQQQEQARLRGSRTISQGNLCLFADLETKSLRLYYKDKEITKAPGLHTSFLFKNVWYDTSSCSWQIRKKKDGFILNLLWEQPRFSSTWKFSLKDNFLFWQAGFKCLDFLDLLKFGLSLIPAYKTFFCAHQQGNFPAQFTHWQDMHLEEPEPALLGLRKVARLPAIVLDNKQHLSSLIQNSDAQTCCRILQLSYPKQSLKKKKYFSFSTKLSLLEEETPIDEYLKQEKQRLLKRQQEERKRVLLKQQQEQARLRGSRTISQGNLRLFADLETKSLRLYYKDKEITKTDGLNSVFRVSREWFSLKSACVQWKIQKISERKMILTLYYEFISLSQIWTLICRDDNTLRIKIEIETNKPIFLTSQDVKLELQNKYENWLTPYEKGSLLVNQYIDNVGPIRLKDNKISGVILKPENESDFPQLFFGASSHLNKRIMGIYKHKEVNGERLCLNSSLIIPKKEGLINPGSRYTYFEGKIALDKDVNLKEESISPRVIKLSKGNLKFAFNRGKGNIFWEDKELTRGLNIYTSVRCSGLWRDSYQATWQVNQKGNNKIVASGAWPHIPIAQKWQIEIIGKNAISWRVDMEIYEEVELDMEQANIMLSSAYKTWIIPGFNQGEFLDEYTQDYDILPFRFWHGKTEEIAATAKTLPRITFKNEMKKDNLRAIVENTDNLYQARLIQYQKTNNRNLLPGIYLYFKGTIEIEPEK